MIDILIVKKLMKNKVNRFVEKKTQPLIISSIPKESGKHLQTLRRDKKILE